MRSELEAGLRLHQSHLVRSSRYSSNLHFGFWPSDVDQQANTVCWSAMRELHFTFVDNHMIFLTQTGEAWCWLYISHLFFTQNTDLWILSPVQWVTRKKGLNPDAQARNKQDRYKITFTHGQKQADHHYLLGHPRVGWSCDTPSHQYSFETGFPSGKYRQEEELQQIKTLSMYIWVLCQDKLDKNVKKHET